jgi:hypothetical protein
MQLVLNEFIGKLGVHFGTATGSAFTQARAKLLHTAFIELNEKAIVRVCYADGFYRSYRGFRLLAVDGSKVILPNEDEIIKHFGSIKIANQLETTQGQYPVAIASVLYDVLNNIAIDSILAPAKAYEVDLAIEHLSSYTACRDLLTFDRNYPSYVFLAFLTQMGIDFVGRCSRSSFKQARIMFEEPIESWTVTLSPDRSKRKEVQSLELPSEINVRFVRVILDTGEVEVLVTSLLDESLYPNEDFKELYNLRWGVETFYGTIKGRLNLENFTGKSVEAVRQDFYSTIFISGLESMLTEDAQQELDEKTPGNKHPQKVNKNVSFNAIKNHAVELFYKEQDTAVILEKLTQLFKVNPVSVRNQRKVPRKKSKPRALLNYHKRIKKICF